MYSYLSNPLTSAARVKWRDEAIAYVKEKSVDEYWIAEQKGVIAKIDRPEGNWFTADMLCFRNGEWMVCRSICNKQNAAIKDLFIGYGSDGKWYYSTFHFCVDKCVLDIQSQPESLAKFVDSYWLVAFDGHSNDSLRKTWDESQPFGDFK